MASARNTEEKASRDVLRLNFGEALKEALISRLGKVPSATYLATTVLIKPTAHSRLFRGGVISMTTTAAKVAPLATAAAALLACTGIVQQAQFLQQSRKHASKCRGHVTLFVSEHMGVALGLQELFKRTGLVGR